MKDSLLKLLCVSLALFVFAVMAWGSSSDSENKPISESSNSSDATSSTQNDDQLDENNEENDLSDVPTEFTLTAGQYYAGIDIPCGKFDLVAISGDGNVSSSNMFSGGVNGMFGGPEADSELYNESFNGVKLPKGERIEISGDLVVQFSYTRVDAGFTGRTEDAANILTLTQGNYDIGVDIPAGIYTIRVTDGSGNVACSVYRGGLNELMGAPGSDNSFITYIPEYKNAYLRDGDELSIGGMTIELIPMIPGIEG